MQVRFTSHWEKGKGFQHILSFPTGMPEQDAKDSVSDADPKMWDHLKEVDRGQVGAYTIVVFDLVI